MTDTQDAAKERIYCRAAGRDSFDLDSGEFIFSSCFVYISVSLTDFFFNRTGGACVSVCVSVSIYLAACLSLCQYHLYSPNRSVDFD